ncbi:MAG: GNAT family N-acetyltransferase [Gemmatimonadales bacterium]
MSGALSIRPYQPGDEAKILALFQEAFGKPMSEAYWRWRFADNPMRTFLIDLMWDGDVLAGHYAVSPVMLQVGTREVPTALSMTTMTHPAYQGRGIFVKLARSLYERMAGSGFAMVWGYPNFQSHRGFVRDLAWEDIYEIPNLRLDVGDPRRLPAPSDSVIPLDGFDHRFDELWARLRARDALMTRRDRAYLDWRYIRNPLHRYAVLGHVTAGRLDGYAVYKQFERALDLVDLVVDGDAGVGADLAAGVAGRAVVLGLEQVNAWLNLTHPLHPALEKLGFVNAGPVTYFGARVLSEAVSAAEARDFRRWYFTMGDSDVF